jgi:hypothetical protein
MKKQGLNLKTTVETTVAEKTTTEDTSLTVSLLSKLSTFLSTLTLLLFLSVPTYSQKNETKVVVKSVPISSCETVPEFNGKILASINYSDELFEKYPRGLDLLLLVSESGAAEEVKPENEKDISLLTSLLCKEIKESITVMTPCTIDNKKFKTIIKIKLRW